MSAVAPAMDSPASAPFPRAALGAVALLGAAAFAPGAIDMAGRWMETEGYFGFGPFIPPACAFFAWSRRAELAAIPRGSSALGLPLIAIAALVVVASVLEDIHFTQNYALVLAVLGIGLVFLGGAVVRRAWFSFVFLGAMVPLPQVSIVHLTFQLKIVAAQLSVAAISAFGVPVILEGSTIHLPSTSLTVDDVCSGLRTLFALIALAAVFAYYERSRIRSALVLLLAAPIAIVANVARILILCALTANELPAQAGTWQHEGAGIATYVVALALLMAIRAAPGGDAEGAGEGAGEGAASTGSASPSAPEAPPLPHRAPGTARIAIVLALLAPAAIVSAAFGFRAEEQSKSERTRLIPATIGEWTGADIHLSQRVFALLGTDDALMRRYTSARSRMTVDLYVIHATDSRKVAHPPEICFSGGGYTARESGVAPVPGAAAGLKANRMVLDKGPDAILVYHWYRLDGADTPSYVGHQLGNLARRLKSERTEGSMFRLSTVLGRDGIAGAEARIEAFSREALSQALAVIP